MNQVFTIHYALQERPEKISGCVTDSGHSGRGRGRKVNVKVVKEREKETGPRTENDVSTSH